MKFAKRNNTFVANMRKSSSSSSEANIDSDLDLEKISAI